MKTDDLITVILLFGFLPIIVGLLTFYIQKARHNERMTMIEKGINIMDYERKEGPFQDVLMWGLLAGGFGLGLFIGYSLMQFKIFNDDAIMGILAILFGGIGLIVYYFIRRNVDKK